MQQPQFRSVSDIYGTDEIDFLLDEIRDLEPTCCQEELQDYEIAGSRVGEISITPLESPLGTCSSWDSHLNYRERLGQAQLAWGVALHCDSSHLKTPTGIVRILLVVSFAKLFNINKCNKFYRAFQDLISLLPGIRMLRWNSTSWTFFTAIDWTIKIDGKYLLLHCTICSIVD